VFEKTIIDNEPGGDTLTGNSKMPAANNPAAAGISIPGYEVASEIGRGGMSVVYRARDTRLNRDVAIKQLLPEYAQKDAVFKRLLIEAQAIANLQHPNIASIYDIVDKELSKCFIMELVLNARGETESLQDYVSNRGPLPVEAAVILFQKLCSALGYVHDKNIVHRDIKPSNILLNANFEPKLIDFGIAHVAEDISQFSGLTMEGSTIGTIDYMAPEQEDNSAKVDSRADIYAMGGVFYYCLTGYTPRYYRESLVADELKPIIAKAIEWNPINRYQKASEMNEALMLKFPFIKNGAGKRTETNSPEPAEAERKGSEASVHKCPICGLRNREEETFECRVCGRDYLCRDHFNKELLCCKECGEKQRKEAEQEAEAKRKAEEKRKAEAKRKKEREQREKAKREEEQRRAAIKKLETGLVPMIKVEGGRFSMGSKSNRAFPMNNRCIEYVWIAFI